jgi:hypothetical protein
MLTYRNFAAALINSFPELRSVIELEDRRIATLANAFPTNRSIRADRIAGWFSRYTQSTIDADDREMTARCFQFAAVAFRDSDQYVRNAIVVSYLRPLELTEHVWAHQIMPPELRMVYREVREYVRAYLRELVKLGV